MYTLIWIPSALDDLAEMWLQADAAMRQQITAASGEIDRRLKRNPLDEGESREQERRILLVSPLGVKYVVSEDDKLVRVLNVWQFAKRSA